MNVYAEDGYTVNQLNEGGDTKTLHNSIDLVSEKMHLVEMEVPPEMPIFII